MSFASSKRPPLGGRLEEEGAKFGGRARRSGGGRPSSFCMHLAQARALQRAALVLPGKLNFRANGVAISDF